jgi:phage protein D
MNKFHRLLRKRKSVTYADKTDQQILTQVASDSGLTLQYKGPSITYKHVYQHNQTDMEFMRTRAARIGCHLWCVGTTLYCMQPDLGKDSGIKLDAKQAVSEGPQLRSFTPRLSSAPTLSKVTVKGWNPETKELITGTASAQKSPLGDNNASGSSSEFGDNEGFTVDHPIWSAEEANALAAAHLQDTALKYMTGEVEAVGDPVFELATVITVTVNTEASDTFNGKYYVAGISYRHIAGGKGKDGGFVSMLRLLRDAQEGSH